MSQNGEEDEDLYDMVLGEQFTGKEKKEVKKKEEKEATKSEPDYAGLFRQLLIGSRAQIAQLKADNEKLKTNLQNAINSGGVVVCPNCTHHFNDRLCLLKPRSMRKMRARNCVELEFSNEDDLEAWLHLNQLETNHDGLPTIFKVPKESSNQKTSLKDVGSLLPQLDAFRIPKRRVEDVKVQEGVKKKKIEKLQKFQKPQKPEDVRAPETKKHRPEDVKKPNIQKPQKPEDVKKDPSKLPLKDRITMPSEDVRKRKPEEKDSEDVERKKRRAIVWEEPEPTPVSSSSTTSSKFAFKITERAKKEPIAAPEPVKVAESKTKFKFVPTSMKNKQDPRTVQSTSSGVTNSEAKSEKGVKIEVTSSSGAEGPQKKPISIPIPKLDVKIQKPSSNSEVAIQKPEDVKKRSSSKSSKDRNLEDVKIQKTSNSEINNQKPQKTMIPEDVKIQKKSTTSEAPIKKPEDVKKRSSSKSAKERNLEDVKIQKASKQSKSSIPEDVKPQKSSTHATSSSSEASHQKTEDVKVQKSSKNATSSSSETSIQKPTPKAAHQNSDDVTKKKKNSEDVKPLQKRCTPSPSNSDGPFKKRVLRQALEVKKNITSSEKAPTSSTPDVLGKILNRCTFPTSSENSLQNSKTVTSSEANLQHLKSPTSSTSEERLQKTSPKIPTSSAPEQQSQKTSPGIPTPSWNLITVKKSPEVLEHIQKHAARRLKEGRRQIDEMIVVNEPPKKMLSLESLGVSKEGLEILKRQLNASKGKEDVPSGPCAPAPGASAQCAPNTPARGAQEKCGPNGLTPSARTNCAPNAPAQNAQCAPAQKAQEQCVPSAPNAQAPSALASRTQVPCAPTQGDPNTPAQKAQDRCAPAPTKSAPARPAQAQNAQNAPAPNVQKAPAPCAQASAVQCASAQRAPAPNAPARNAPASSAQAPSVQCAPAQRAQDKCAPAPSAPAPSAQCAPSAPAPVKNGPNAPARNAQFAPAPSAPAPLNHAPAPHAPTAPEDDDDVLKEFFPTLSHPPKRFSLLQRQNSEFSTCSESTSAFADVEELELLNLMRVESVIPPDGDVGLEGVQMLEVDDDDFEDDVKDDDEDDVDDGDDFCLEDVVIDENQRVSMTTSESDEWDLEHVEEPIRSESNVLEMNNDFRLSDDEDAISPVTSTPKRQVLEDDVHLGEDDDFTMGMRDDSFHDELDWNYGLEGDEEVALDEIEEGEITEENLHVANSEEQKTSRRETVALLKRRN